MKKSILVAVPVVLLLAAGLAAFSLYSSFKDVKNGIEDLKINNIEQAKQISELSVLNEKLKTGRFFRDEEMGVEMILPTDYEEVDLNGSRAIEFGPKEKIFFGPFNPTPKQLEAVKPMYRYKVEFATSTAAEEAVYCKECGGTAKKLGAKFEEINGLKVASWLEAGDPGFNVMVVTGGQKNYIFSDWLTADYGDEENPSLNYFREIIKTIKLIKK